VVNERCPKARLLAKELLNLTSVKDISNKINTIGQDQFAKQIAAKLKR